MIQIIDPTRSLVNVRNGAAENLKILSIYTTAAAGAANVSLVAAESGKRHRVVGWHFSAGLAGNSGVSLKNGSGGATLLGINMLAGVRDFAPINLQGYFETSTNTALVYDWTTTNGLINVYYITYTP